jgi:hypothetical protein
MATSDGPKQEPSKRSFRLAVWAGVIVVVAIGVWSVTRRQRPSGPPPGTIVDAELTLITSDRSDVACVSTKTFDSFACGFSADAVPRHVEERDTLRPYMTADRHVYLIPGLFLQPALARRYQSEPPTVPRERLRRFTAKCKLKKAGQLEGFKLRWAETGAWSEPQNADVVTVVACEVVG